MSKEILSMLSTKPVNYAGVGGGKPAVTWEMVSQVLAQLPDHISAYARMKYNGEYRGEGYGSHFHVALDAVRALAACRDMHERMRADRFLSMTRTALMEAVAADSVCPSCSGTKQVLSNKSYHQCPLCNGIGKLKFNNIKVAALIGYSNVRSYQRYGKEVYTELLNEILGHWESAISRECGRLNT